MSICYELVVQRAMSMWSRIHSSPVCLEMRVDDHVTVVLVVICGLGRILGFTLAPLADDLILMRVVLLIDFLVFGRTWWAARQETASEAADPLAKGEYEVVNNIIDHCRLGFAALLFIAMVSTLFSRDAWRMLMRIRLNIALWMIAESGADLVSAVIETWICRSPSHQWWYVIGIVVAYQIIRRPRLQWWLKHKFAAHSAEHAAAGIAGLIGKDNRPNPSLFDKSVPIRLRSCDAFVSHSWHDNPEAKWAVLQAWRVQFLQAHGREPMVWLDKCCIDQTDIEANLRCLPIFLSGCRSLLVLCGTTYLSRLWCILEIFTFVHVGGKISDIDLKTVLREGYEAGDMAVIAEGFDHFDAEECTCFDPAEKGRMLSIIHAAFGCSDGFNEVVRGIFETRGWRSSGHLESPSSTSDSTTTSFSGDSRHTSCESAN
eukprot:CAMPEP_0115757900 /NCGR_PEP_ID=MMETSP0272-20121206/98660_1 /TAXON_ID=71861 /ORGANISM="Scrippsiella trochoidea, Strain CCMP3099" /LENGTH=429 /DNA_ID=CAMNT_0003203425 /DNA_START=99 /DNA_END=1388 /DNA_ORIENTATION=+